MKNDDKIIK